MGRSQFMLVSEDVLKIPTLVKPEREFNTGFFNGIGHRAVIGSPPVPMATTGRGGQMPFLQADVDSEISFRWTTCRSVLLLELERTVTAFHPRAGSTLVLELRFYVVTILSASWRVSAGHKFL